MEEDNCTISLLTILLTMQQGFFLCGSFCAESSILPLIRNAPLVLLLMSLYSLKKTNMEGGREGGREG